MGRAFKTAGKLVVLAYAVVNIGGVPGALQGWEDVLRPLGVSGGRFLGIILAILLVYSLVPSAVRTQIESRVGFKGSDEEAGQAASDDTSVVATSATQSTTTASQEPAALLKAKRTSDEHFPRVESAKDSLGHAAERPMHGGSFYAHTGHVLRPGQQVTFELEASDPNGDDLELSVIAPARGEADVAIADGIVTWNVRDQDIADPAHLNIYVASQRSYHRQQDWDDAAVFVYRVLPRL